MWLVADTNFLTNSKLESLLRREPRARIIISDYVGMEVAKGKNLEDLRSSLRILRNLPERVRFLRPTVELYALDLSNEDPRDAMLDAASPQRFREFCGAAFGEDTSFARQLTGIDEARAVSGAWMDAAAEPLEDLDPAIEWIAEDFSGGDLASLRKGMKVWEVRPDLAQHRIAQMARQMNTGVERHLNLSLPPLTPDSVLFRRAAVAYFWSVARVAAGGLNGQRADRLRNDAIDGALATFATFYDGPLSADARLLEQYADAVIGLKALYGLAFHSKLDGKTALGSPSDASSSP